jgi:hypothetical protein
MGMRNYEFAHLSKEQIDQIQQLEQTLMQQTGDTITLIAFAPDDDIEPASECRAALDE